MTRSTYSANHPYCDQTNLYTPLRFPELASAIAHINEEHYDELIGFLTAFTALSSEDIAEATVQLVDIYAEVIVLQVQPTDAKKTSTQSSDQTFFIPFTAPITQFSDLNTQYILLKQKADKKLGKKTIKLTTQTFVVQDSYKVSQNMLRLELTGPNINTSYKNAIPVDEAGYAYLFDLAHNFTSTKGGDTTLTRAHCYYTLRKAWQASDGVRAWVDVFLHGDTPGGDWARSLQAGDTVISKREFPEKTAHLQDGQALLIADETSMPTVARLLELWENPIAPLVVCVTQKAADQAYFDEIKMMADRTDTAFTLLPVVTGQVNSGKALATLIDDILGKYLTTHPLQIDKVWGAMEAGTAKALRGLIQQRLGLERSDSVIKVYWRHD
ncbi:SIP domain-containing protein [Psychrobacter alimentarius]|uniref:SIP domain-containing protein n=1 Tax=Psychrobacter alimentarius TaxID=261164 RepID=UPI003FD3FB00